MRAEWNEGHETLITILVRDPDMRIKLECVSSHDRDKMSALADAIFAMINAEPDTAAEAARAKGNG